MQKLTNKQIVNTIGGVVALCLGSADRIVWVNQADAAAFSDGEKIYLPKPTGEHAQEYDLLLAIALREVAKFYYCDTDNMASTRADINPYAAAIEEARIKMVLGKTYLGAKSIFDTALNVVNKIITEQAKNGNIPPEAANQMAVWASAHDGYINTVNSSQTAGSLAALAALSTDPGKLEKALTLSRQVTDTTHEAVELGIKVWQALQADPAEQEPPPVPSQDAQEEAETSPQDGNPESQAAAQPPGEKPDAGPQDNASSDTEQGNNPDGSPKEDADGNEMPPDQGGGAQDASSPQGEQPQDQASGDTPQGAEPQADGQSNSPSDGGSAAQDGAAEGNDAGMQGSRSGSDILSDALAMMKGFPGSVDVASQAGALRKQADAPEVNPTEAQLQAIKAALSLADDAAETLAAAVEVEAETGGDDPQEELSVLLGAGGGYADPQSKGSNSLLSGVQSKLVTVLLKELQDKRRRQFLRGVSGRSVAVSHIWRFRKMGDPRIFRKKSPACGVDTVVSILLDRSASMNNDIEQAANVTYALALAMQRIPGVQVSIDVFPGVATMSEEILAFKQNVRVAQKKLEVMTASGGTPTGSALAQRLPRLLATKVDKKLMLVVTDGNPNLDQRPLAEAMIAQAKEQGVHVIGIGLGIDVGHLFDSNVTVNSVEDLAGALEALFKSELAEEIAA